MLQYAAVDKGTLELLKSLMQLNFLSDFNLVGGTALALQIGHRISIDLDLFTDKNFNPSEIRTLLEQKYTIQNVVESKNGLTQQIEFPQQSGNFIKVDIVKYTYKLLKQAVVIDGIRMLSIEDIIPMKLSAVSNRGSKKDFYDIYYLLKDYNLHEMIALFEKKFSNYNSFYVTKSLIYFEDAEKEPDPKVLADVSWDEVKKCIQAKVQEYS
jgi:predicted nucleotidyltransferase component of viral defense system